MRELRSSGLRFAPWPVNEASIRPIVKPRLCPGRSRFIRTNSPRMLSTLPIPRATYTQAAFCAFSRLEAVSTFGAKPKSTWLGSHRTPPRHRPPLPLQRSEDMPRCAHYVFESFPTSSNPDFAPGARDSYGPTLPGCYPRCPFHGRHAPKLHSVLSHASRLSPRLARSPNRPGLDRTELRPGAGHPFRYNEAETCRIAPITFSSLSHLVSTAARRAHEGHGARRSFSSMGGVYGGSAHLASRMVAGNKFAAP